MSFKWKYMIDVVVLKSGCNIHKLYKIEDLPKTVEVGNKKYNVTVNGLWKLKRPLLKRPLDFFRGVEGRYICLFREGNKEALQRNESKVTPLILRNVKRSRILKQALDEIFRGSFGGIGRILFILFVLIAVGLAVAFTQGWIG